MEIFKSYEPEMIWFKIWYEWASTSSAHNKEAMTEYICGRSFRSLTLRGLHRIFRDKLVLMHANTLKRIRKSSIGISRFSVFFYLLWLYDKVLQVMEISMNEICMVMFDEENISF